MSTLEDTADSEVVRFASDLIRIDTTNTGGVGTVGERVAAEYVSQRLIEAGGRPQLLEAEPGRSNVLLRIPGTQDSGRSAGTVVHGHLDVVPADPGEWTVDPFGGLVEDGFVWGRGAVDMKGTDAVMLAVARRWLSTGIRPRHDVVFAWLADEETGGTLGAQWLCRRNAELFAGCGTALGEVGGFSIPIGPANLYPVMTAERAHAHLELIATGFSGHGSISSAANPITVLAKAVTDLVGYQFPAEASPSVVGFLQIVGKLWGTNLLRMPLDSAVGALGPLGQLLQPSLRHSVVPTMLTAGYSANVVPGRATATLDCRILPGQLDDFSGHLRRILGDEVQYRLTVLTRGMESPFEADVVDSIGASLRAHDPAAVPLPYMVSASTDAAHFAELGLCTYGFSPLELPAGFRFGAMFHGRDEKVPVDGLKFGVTVLHDLLLSL